MKVVAVILAAGASTRLGSPKQLATLAGETLLDRAVRVARDAVCTPVVVLGAAEAEIRAGCRLEDVPTVVNPAWGEGMASSIRVGIAEAIRLGAAWAVLMTCDQPAVSTAHLRQLIRMGQTDPAGEPIASSYPRSGEPGETGRRNGVPAIFPATRFDHLLRLRGDAGARDLLASSPALALPHGELDVDTVLALRKARKMLGDLSEPPSNL